MTRTEHLLFIVAEEGCEVGQRASKAARFSLDEIQPGQPFNNAERIMEEFDDLLAVIAMLQEEGLLPASQIARIAAKKLKIEEFLAYSASVGTVKP